MPSKVTRTTGVPCSRRTTGTIILSGNVDLVAFRTDEDSSDGKTDGFTGVGGFWATVVLAVAFRVSTCLAAYSAFAVVLFCLELSGFVTAAVTVDLPDLLTSSLPFAGDESPVIRRNCRLAELISTRGQVYTCLISRSDGRRAGLFRLLCD